MNWLNIKQLAYATLAVLSILVLIQGIAEISSDADESTKRQMEFLSTKEPVKSSVDNNDAIEQLVNRYNVLQPEEKKEVEKKDENESQEKVEQKKIDKTLRPNFASFDEQNQIGLVAIFDDVKKFAILQLIHFESGKVRFQKLAEGDSIGDYEVESISELSVTLRGPQSSINLSLFKPQKTS